MALEIALGVFIGMMGYRFVMGDWLVNDEDSAVMRLAIRIIMTFLFIAVLSIIYQIALGGTA